MFIQHKEVDASKLTENQVLFYAVKREKPVVHSKTTSISFLENLNLYTVHCANYSICINIGSLKYAYLYQILRHIILR